MTCAAGWAKVAGWLRRARDSRSGSLLRMVRRCGPLELNDVNRTIPGSVIILRSGVKEVVGLTPDYVLAHFDITPDELVKIHGLRK